VDNASCDGDRSPLEQDTMATFVPGQTIATPDSSIEVTVSPTAPLAPGRHRFQLIVVDDSGNESEPTVAEVIVVDDKKPTAVLDAPARVSFGASFKLSGARSADLPPGRIREFRWLLIS
jgi:hypothetical protein